MTSPLARTLFAFALLLSVGCSPRTAASPQGTAEGLTNDLRQFEGKTVLLTFGATWCPMCSIELRELELAQRKLAGAALKIVAVLIDEDRDRVAAFVRENGLTFPVLTDPGGALQAKYKVLSLPATIALDARGTQIPLIDPESGATVMQIDGPRSWDKASELEQLRRLAAQGK